MPKTSQQKQADITRATNLIHKIGPQLEVLNKAREAAELLAASLRDLECCLANANSAAAKVIANPSAQACRDLDSSLAHAEAFGRKRARKARLLALRAVDAAEATGAFMRDTPEAAQVDANGGANA